MNVDASVIGVQVRWTVLGLAKGFWACHGSHDPSITWGSRAMVKSRLHGARLMLATLLAFASLNTALAASDGACHPLLLMIEGGGPSSDGSSMEGLTDRISKSLAGGGVTVVNVDNGPFWTAFFHRYRPRKVKDAVQRIQEAQYWPLVIVGHSLGAATAWHLARSLPTSLLVTLDGVSYNDNRRAPANARQWRNVWVDQDAFGPDWGPEPNADVDYSVGDFSHSDVQQMWSVSHRRYGSVADAVSRALECQGVPTREPQSKLLCDLEAVGCEARWKLTDGCRDGHGIDMRFFEYDVGWNRIASWRPQTIPSGESETFRLDCEGPANWVCYGGQRPSGHYWGRGLDGKKGCEDCCLNCRHAQPIESIDFVTTKLTCRDR